MKATDGGEVYSPNVGGTLRSVLFCRTAEKEQFDYAEGIIKFKRTYPRGRTVGSSPLVHSFGTFLLHNRKVHFSTVGGLHGVRLPRPKNFFKNASRRRSASTLLHRRWPSRRAPAKAKELFLIKKQSPPGIPARTANLKFN